MGGKRFAIDLFAGGGGLSLGSVMAGLNVRVAIEKDHNAAETYRTNHPNVTLVEKDIKDIQPCDLPISHPPTVIVAGPPCQPFSTSNQKTRSDENPLNQLLFEPLRFAKFFEPCAVVI